MRDVRHSCVRNGTFVAATLAMAFAGAANAADGPGLGNLTYTASQVPTPGANINSGVAAPLKMLYSTGQSGESRNQSHSFMHRGYLYVITARDSGNDGGGIEIYRFLDPKNPGSPHYKRSDSVTRPIREVHAYGMWRSPADNKEYVALQAKFGIQIWDVTNPELPALAKDMTIAGVGTPSPDYNDGVWWISAQPPFLYLSGSRNGLIIVCVGPASGVSACNSASPTNPIVAKRIDTDDFGGFRTNMAQAVGNVLMVGLSDSSPGQLAFYDISDPMNPDLKVKQAAGATAKTYTYLMSGPQNDAGKLYVYSSARGGDANGFRVLELNHTTSPWTISERSNIPPSSSQNYGDVKIGYGNFQVDCGPNGTGACKSFVHFGYSERYFKIDVTNPASPIKALQGRSSEADADEDFVTVIGNVVFAGNDHDPADKAGSAIYAHQMHPDKTPPAVTYVNPRPGATGLSGKIRIGAIFSDNVDMRTLTTANFMVRPVGGSAIAGTFAPMFHYVNFTPSSALASGSYEIVVNGVKDWAGNAMTTQFLSTFTVGTAAAPANCVVSVDGSTTPPVKQIGTGGTTDQNVSVTVSGCTATGALDYIYQWGDGTTTGPTASSSVSHDYGSSTGHFQIIVEARVPDGASYLTRSFVRNLTVVYPPTAQKPTRSTPIFYDDRGTATDYSDDRLHVVNPDRNSVRSFKVADIDNPADPNNPSMTNAWEAPVPRNPRTLAVRPGTAQLWVVSQDDPSIFVLNALTGAYAAVIHLPNGSRPFGIAFNPTGTAAFVTLEGSGKLIKIDPALANPDNAASMAPGNHGFPLVNPIVAELALPGGAKPRGVAVHGDGNRVLVTRFITNANDGSVRDANNAAIYGGDLYEVSAGSMTLVRTTKIAADPDVNDTESSGRGMPNYLQAVAISPDGRKAVVPSKKDNIYRGVFRDGRTLNFENTVRTTVSIVDMVNNYQMDMGPAYPTVANPDSEYDYRRDINNADMANAAVFTRNGDWILISHHNNQVSVYDGLDYKATNILGLDVTGLTPQGLAIKPDDSRLYVWNFMSRNVEVHDISTLGAGNNFVRKATASFQTSEPLPANILRGKKVFYNSADDRMSRDDYIACASCHLEGGADETVFDFTDAGEGLRNTVTLLGRRGMGHGRVHWSANFDEIQDFEHSIRTLFGGTGLLSNADFNSGTRNQPLGDLKSTAPSAVNTTAGGLNDMSDYVSSLTTVPRSPYRNVDGTLNTSVPVMGGTGNGVTGKALFASRGCVNCHSGRDFTDSVSGVLHNVGTITSASGNRLGVPLTGVDTPTLLGVWNTAPYLHDGSAPNLETVLANTTHVGALADQDKRDLVAYLKQIDDMGRDFTISSFTVNDAGSPEWSLRGNLGVGDIAYGDRAYTWSSIPAIVQDAAWIRTAADSKTFGPGTVASFVVDKGVDVFIGLDDRCNDEAGEKPTWMDGTWTDTGADMQVREHSGVIRTLSLWKKSMPAGTINLPGQIDGNTGLANTDAQNYTVALKATPPGTAPAAPTGLMAVAGDRAATLSWVASAGALYYQVLRSTTSGTGYTQIANNVSATSYADSNLTNGITYYYVTRAVNGTGASGNSAQASATPSCAVLAAPTGLSLTPGTGQVTLSWSAVAGAAGYNIKRSTTSSTSPPTVANSVTNVYTNTGLTAGQPYYFRVSATNSCGESADSAEAGPVAPTAAGSMNVALIAKDTDDAAAGVQLTAGDVSIQQYLVDLGFAVTTVAEAVSSSTDASGKQLVIISRSVGSGNITTKFDTVAVPVMVNEGLLLIDMRLSASETTTNQADQTSLHIQNAASPLAAGLTGDPVVTIAPVSFAVGAPLASADNVATLVGDAARSPIFAYESGAALASGTAPARRISFFLDDNGAAANMTAPQLNADGRSLFSSAVMWAVGSGSTAPATPTNLAVTSTSGQANLTWTGSAGATTYNVKRGTSRGGPYMQQAQVSGTSFRDTSVADGTTYYYVVTAVNTTGESGNSNEVSTTPGCTMPPAPTGVTAGWSGTQANLAWNMVGTANSYKVKRSTDGSNYSTIASGVTTNAYVNTGLTAGTSYYYTVSSVNACGESAPSATVCASSAGCVYGGAAPQVGVNGSAVIVQGENYDVNGFNDVDGVNSGPGASYRADGWDLDNASCGTGCWNVGWFATNDWTQYTIDVRATGTYTLKLRTATSTTTGNKKAKVYVDGMAINGGADIILANTTSYNTYAETTVSNVALTAGLRIIRVLVSAGSWNFDYMSWTLNTPAAPTGLTGAASPGQVSLAWNAVNGATGYQVKRSTTSGSGYANVGSPVTGTSYLDTGLVNGTAYYYVVAASNNAGAGANSAQAAATPSGPSTAPTGVTATPGANQIVISWTAVSGATSYKVLRSTTSGTGYTQVGTPTTTSWAHTGVTNGTYYYVVQTVNGSGTSGNSVEVIASLGQPDRDAYVRSGTSAGNNYGTATTMEVKATADANTKRNGFMRFSIAGADATVNSAKLRIYANTGASAKTMAVCGVTDIGWSETAINWNYPSTNAGGPAMSTTCTNVSVPVTAAYIEIDVTSWVAARRAAGDTFVTLGMKWTAESADGQTNINSRENGSNKPQLWIGSKP
jgi:fibronectin type 3 domain-containing protein